MADGLPTWSSVMMTPGCTATATRLRRCPKRSTRSAAPLLSESLETRIRADN